MTSNRKPVTLAEVDAMIEIAERGYKHAVLNADLIRIQYRAALKELNVKRSRMSYLRKLRRTRLKK